MEVAPFFVDFHHFLSIFTIYALLSRFTFCRDLRTFSAIFFWPKLPSPQHHTFFACMMVSLWQLFYCRAYMVIQCSDPICSAEEWCTTEDRMKAPPGEHLLPQCSVTQCNSSTHKAKFTQNKRSFHCFIATMDSHPQVHLPAEKQDAQFC